MILLFAQLIGSSLLGCAEPAGGCDPGTLSQGALSASVDGQDWQGAGVQWNRAGDGVQITTDATGGWRLTLVATTDAGGQSVGELIDSGAFPIEVTLGAERGQALVYPEGGGSLTTQQGGGGTLVLQDLQGDALSACFELNASSADGSEQLQLSDGLLVASPL